VPGRPEELPPRYFIVHPQVDPHGEQGSSAEANGLVHLTSATILPSPDTSTSPNWPPIYHSSYGGVDVRHIQDDGRGAMAKQIPLVDYLELGDHPHLTAHECASCGARFFDRRNACASCGKTEFAQVDVSSTGEVRAFTIVAFAAPGVPVPYVAALVDCAGTSVRANLINVEPDPEHVRLGMKVQLATNVIGTDNNGTEAIGFGFEPIGD
jgi:uncharacterized protein